MSDWPLVDVPFSPDELGSFPSTGGAAVAFDVLLSAFAPCRPVGDATAPIVTFVSPLAGGTLAPTDSIIIDVTDNLDDIELVTIAMVQAGSADVEMVYADGFMPRYSGQSTRATIVGGYRFTIKRHGGWPQGATVTLRVWVIDGSGNQA